MPIFATKDILIDSLRLAGEEKDKIISRLVDDTIELERKVIILRGALDLVDKWLARERERLTPDKH